MAKKLDERVYEYLLGLFSTFSNSTVGELRDMMYKIADIAENCEIETIDQIVHYFMTEQVENLPNVDGCYQRMFSEESELRCARMLEYYLEQKVDDMRMGGRSLPAKTDYHGIKVCTNNFDEIINIFYNSMESIREFCTQITQSIGEKDDIAVYVKPLMGIANGCVSAIDTYIQVACGDVKDGRMRFVSGVNKCVDAAREASMQRENVVAVKWPVEGGKR